MMRLCSIWGIENVQWKDANWTWTECQLVDDICKTWGNANWLWKDAYWKWSECAPRHPGNPPGVDANTLIPPWIEEPWNPYRAADREQAEKKRRKLIKLICKVKGVAYDEEKELKNFKVTVKDIKLIVKAVKGIDLDLKMEN